MMGLLPGLISGQSWYAGASFHPWFIFGFLFWLLPLFVFGAIVFVAARWLLRPTERQCVASGGSGALAILEERYARGEITKEQFAQMKQDIQR
jgi:putative membrane protein